MDSSFLLLFIFGATDAVGVARALMQCADEARPPLRRRPVSLLFLFSRMFEILSDGRRVTCMWLCPLPSRHHPFAEFALWTVGSPGGGVNLQQGLRPGVWKPGTAIRSSKSRRKLDVQK